MTKRLTLQTRKEHLQW